MKIVMKLVKKKKSRIQVAREIIANLRRGMDRPRLAESVHNGLSASAPLEAAPAARFKPSRPVHASSS
jgi:hypothetical protein